MNKIADDNIGMSAILGMVLHELGGRVTLTAGLVKEFMEMCGDTRHFVDIRTDSNDQVIVTTVHEKVDGSVEETYLGIDYEKEYPKGCLSGLR